MATTIPRRYPTHAVTLLEVTMRAIAEGYREALGDLDKADDPEDMAYYAGLLDAYTDVLGRAYGIDDHEALPDYEEDR